VEDESGGSTQYLTRRSMGRGGRKSSAPQTWHTTSHNKAWALTSGAANRGVVGVRAVLARHIHLVGCSCHPLQG
jgi:hypothetical protein